MSLETGTYIIVNQLTRAPIGSAPAPGPLAKVVGLPGGVEAPRVSERTFP